MSHEEEQKESCDLDLHLRCGRGSDRNAVIGSWDPLNLRPERDPGDGSSGSSSKQSKGKVFCVVDGYTYVPALHDELALLILARVPRSEFWKLRLLTKRYLSLLRSGELYKLRREIGIQEPVVFILVNGESRWWVTDRKFISCRELPVVPCSPRFAIGEEESFCAGSQLLVSSEVKGEGAVIWRYEVAMNRWYISPSMITPRSQFAYASCGNFACVAGGIKIRTKTEEILCSAEKYNPDKKSWEPLPSMHRQRKLCKGCYMDNKFFVIGGKDEMGATLRCGESYYARSNTWELILDMSKGVYVSSKQFPHLIAVVNNELYCLESFSNQVKVYLKTSNSWKSFGSGPLSGFGNRSKIAFHSLGDELFVIGAACNYSGGYYYSGEYKMPIYACFPDPEAEVLQWRLLGGGGYLRSHFVLNCSIMEL